MTESLADGPDWHPDPGFVQVLHFPPQQTQEAVPQRFSPTDSILEDKELMQMHVDLQKNVSRFSMCIPNAWRPFFAARRYE